MVSVIPVSAGGSALDAVEMAVSVMEDDPTFDAGVGSVLNCVGDIELDAIIMDGRTLALGSVAAVRGITQVTLETPDIEATRAALAAKGVTPVLDVTEVAPLGIKVMYLLDPEGNAIELWQPPSG